jgi:hypothetical protein
MVQTLLVGAQGASSYPALSEALAAAADGAVIRVSAGVYAETVHVTRATITVVAADGPGTVEIDASTLPYPAVSCTGGSVTLQDLTIRAGDAPVAVVDGGRLTMHGCTIQPRLAAGVRATNGSHVDLRRVTVHGGHHGFVIDDSTGTIAECEISDVTGDGIIVRHGADPTIRQCVVRNCGERGCYVYQFGRPTLEDCTINDVGDAGVAVVHESRPIIRRSRVTRARGAGIAFGRGCGGSVVDCEFEEVGAEEIAVATGANPVVERTAGAGTAGADPDDPEIARCLGELDGMIGLAGVKDQVRSLIDEIQVNEWRRLSGLNAGNTSNHLIFAGPPGTGKTTVARIYGRILTALKVLPKGQFVEVTRQDLVVGYFGHTAPKTTEVFMSALGGVLFIDEAHTLSRTFAGSNRDFGQEAIDTLVKLMEDHRDEIVVIAAGYTQDMVGFLAANPGLASRFARTIDFDSYTPDELIEIGRFVAAANDYALEPEAELALRRHFTTLERDEHFGNAREVRKLFEAVRKAQARRLRRLGRRPDLDELRTLLEEDLHTAVELNRAPA